MAANRGVEMDVFTVIDRGSGQKPFWLKVGVCTVNKDGSFSVQLDAYPRDGRLQIRARVPAGAVEVRR